MRILLPQRDWAAEITDPMILKDRIPGFAAAMDEVKDLREAYREEAKLMYGVLPDAQHLGSVHPATMYIWMVSYGGELLADDCKLLKKLLRKHSAYQVAKP